jgi:hypothetical protein
LQVVIVVLTIVVSVLSYLTLRSADGGSDDGGHAKTPASASGRATPEPSDPSSAPPPGRGR